MDDVQFGIVHDADIAKEHNVAENVVLFKKVMLNNAFWSKKIYIYLDSSAAHLQL